MPGKRMQNDSAACSDISRGPGLSRREINRFRKIIREHYLKEKRQMPWRSTKSPYRILVSEIMLQQTPVGRVLGKYRLFLKTFPDFPALAEAKLSDVLKVWQGLGYNRRAISLKRIADIVVSDHHCRLPGDIEELRRLPGIGSYTASAIHTFVSNRPSLFIETNIRRVFLHFFFNGRENVRDDEIMPVLEKTLDIRNPRQWYYALMDYGVKLRKESGNPNMHSAHYRRQSPFSGSARQIRGMVLKLLLQGRAMSEAEIRKHLPSPVPVLVPILNELLREGFIRRTGRRYVIS